MGTTLNPSLGTSAPPPTPNSESSGTADLGVPDFNGPSLNPAAYTNDATSANMQDGYAATPIGVRGSVLSTPPPVPNDVDTGTFNKADLHSAESKLSYLGQGSAGEQALSLGAQDPAAQSSQDYVPNSPIPMPDPAPAGKGPSATQGDQTSGPSSQADDKTEKAKQMSSGWVDNVGKKCKHSDHDMAKATGIDPAVAKMAYDLMKKDKTDALASQLGTAMAVLAQEKQEKSPNYEADKEKVAHAIKTLNANYDAQFIPGKDDSVAINNTCQALVYLSQVVTAQLGTDPNGKPTSPGSSFDPRTAAPVNPFA